MKTKNVYYPLAGMNYVIDDLAQIIENKMDGKNQINLWLVSSKKIMRDYTIEYIGVILNNDINKLI